MACIGEDDYSQTSIDVDTIGLVSMGRLWPLYYTEQVTIQHLTSSDQTLYGLKD